MTRSAVLALACVALFGLASAGMAAPADLPRGFTVPGEFREDPTRRKFWDFDSAQYDYVPAGKRDMAHQKVEGHLWRTAVTATTLPANNADGVLALIANGFEKDGWTILRRQGALVAHKAGGGLDLWISGSGNGGYFPLVLMQTAPPARSLTLRPPQPQVEAVSDTQDLPYALPLPGSKMEKTIYDHRSFEVILPNTKQPFYAVPDETRWYDEPPGVSSYEFVAVYRTAFESAGWDVVRAQVGGDAVVIAHYAKNGRDIWLYTRGDGVRQNLNVVDYGAQSKASSLKQQLARDGHVALYGIYFDTDSSVPRPESDATLQNVLQLLKADVGLKLEVQGHTDDTGTPDHNAALSDARAASVRQWLVAHGIAAARLASKGYGSTRPVADNRTPEGKAKNRRVELAGLGSVAAAAAAAPGAVHVATSTNFVRADPKGSDIELACALGPVKGEDHSLSIRNASGHVLKGETIINLAMTWTTPGGIDDCFPLEGDLAVNGSVSHAVKLDRGVIGKSCTAYVSSAKPSMVHRPDGATFSECDPR